jgi:hypothetical protein
MQWKYGIIFVFIFFNLCCQHNKKIQHSTPKLACVSILKSDKNRHVDSLINLNSIPQAYNLYKKLPLDHLSDETVYLNYKMNKAIFYHKMLYPCDSLVYQPIFAIDTLNGLHQSFHKLNQYYCHNTPIDDVFLKTQITSCKEIQNDLILKSELYSDLGSFYYYDKAEIDSANIYLLNAYNALSIQNLGSFQHMINCRVLAYLQFPLRNNHISQFYAEKIVKDLPIGYNLDDNIYLLGESLVAFCNFRINEFEKGNLHFNKIFKKIKKEHCYFGSQEFFKLYFAAKTLEKENLDKVDEYLIFIQELVEEHGDFCNYNKVVGEWHLYNKDYFKSQMHLEKAYAYIHNNRPFNFSQLFTVMAYLKSSYTQNKEYDKALNVVATQISENKSPDLLIYDKNKILGLKDYPFYHFMNTSAIADVLFLKFNDTKNLDYLYDALEFINQSDLQINQELKTLDDQTLESIYFNSTEVYKTGAKVAYTLFEYTNHDSYVDNFLYFIEKNKTRILHRDQILQKTTAYLKNEERNIRLKIKEFQSKGFNDSLYYYHTLLQKFTNNNIDVIKLIHSEKSKSDLPILISKVLRDSSIYIDFTEFNQDFYITLYTPTRKSISFIGNNSILYNAIKELKNIHPKMIIDSLTYLSSIVAKSIIPKEISSFKKMFYSTSGIFSGFNPELLVLINDSYLIDKIEMEYTESLYLQTGDSLSKSNSAISAIFFSDLETIKRETFFLKELPGNILEAKILQQYFKNTKFVAGANCSKTNFTNVILHNPSEILHISTHGVGNANNHNDVYLLFRSKNKVDTLYGYELLTTPRDFPLVVLSSCQTGLGKYIEGEGNYSLAKYFYHCGTKKVITSLWNLDDTASGLLFSIFYKHINQGLSPSRSLYLAKQQLRNKYRNFRHPYFWGGVR